VQPFKVQIKQALLDDLRERLAHRWADEITGALFSRRSLRLHEELMNTGRTGLISVLWRVIFAHFRADVDGEHSFSFTSKEGS